MSNPRDHHDHDHHDNAPGRIPESLIHAALDGEVSDDTQREIADALKYDKARHRELLDTADAIRALRTDMHMPDFSGNVLATLDRQNRYIPASWQRVVRNGRMGVAAALLLTLMSIAGLQHLYPRLATIGHQDTPVRNIAQAVESDATQMRDSIRDEVRLVRASIVPSRAPLIQTPGRTDFSFALDIDQSAPRLGSSSAGLQVFTMPRGYAIYIPSSNERFPASTRLTASMSNMSNVSLVSWTNGQSAHETLGSTGGQRLILTKRAPVEETEPLELP